jgi:hypothetical protein
MLFRSKDGKPENAKNSTRRLCRRRRKEAHRVTLCEVVQTTATEMGHECRDGARKVERVGGVGRDKGGGGEELRNGQETASLRTPVGAGGGMKEKEATVFYWGEVGGSGSDIFWGKRRRGCLRGFGGA